MTSDIHPHWKSTGEGSGVSPQGDDREFWPMDGEAHHHVRVNGGGASSFFLLFAFSTISLAALGVVFYQGVNRIRADLLEGRSPDVVIEVQDAAFSPASLAVQAGQLVEWKNVGSGNQQLRSDQLDDAGTPFVSSPLIPAGGTYRSTLPLELAGTMLTIRSAFVPTMMQTITIETPVEAPSSEVPSDAAPDATSSLPPLPPSAPSSPSLPSLPPIPPPPPTPSTPSTPTLPTLPSIPSVPSVPSTPTPVIQIGSTDTPSLTSAWPSLLRINRFTISPIHAARQAQEEWQRSSYSAAPLARRQPETGPALWVLSVLTLGTMPFFFRKAKGRREGAM